MKKNLQYKGEWSFVVQKSFILNESISMGAKMVYIAILSFCGPDLTAFPSTITLAKSLGISRETVNKYVSELKQIGLLETEQRGKAGKFSHTFFTLHEPDRSGKNPLREKPVTEKSDTNSTPVQKLVPKNSNTGSQTSRFIGLWCTEYLSKFGQRYAAVTPRDAQAAKRFFDGNAHVEAEAVVRVARTAWEHGNPNTHWNCSRSRSIAAFLNSYNEVIGEVGVVARTDAEKYGAPGPRDFEGRPL